MTDKKLRDYLARDFETPSGQKTLIPILFSDSKGIRLQRAPTTNQVETSIVYWCKAGDKIENRFSWLEENLENKLRLLGSVHLYIWLGTCNITTRDKNGYISLTTNPNETLDHIVSYYHKIIDLVCSHSNCKATVLDVPVYSISAYNARLNHKRPQQFYDQDSQLVQLILDLNRRSGTINQQKSTLSPNFNRNLYTNSKSWNYAQTALHTRTAYNINLYEDGLHPCPLLARVWLRKLAHQIKADCWTA